MAQATNIGLMIWQKRLLAWLLCLNGALCISMEAGLAQSSPSRNASPQDNAARTQDAIKTHEMTLRGLEDVLGQSQAQRQKIETEMDALRNDRARLNASLIDTTARVSAGETRLRAAEQRMASLSGSEEAIRHSLEGRQSVVAEVLAALQRMGRKPPPALLVSPEDILLTIRSSMLLGAVLPELRAETQALASDLADLVALRKSLATERDNVARELSRLAEERTRLAALIEARQNAMRDSEKALEAERERAKELALQATSLKDLIARMETEVASASRAAQEAQRADELRKAQTQAQVQAPTRSGVPLSKDPARLAPALAFADTKGQLPLPVSGEVFKTYGVPDGFGSTEKGLSLATRPRAVVAAPSDGWVSFSGPYRTYGQILILNAGNGYYIVLAGMDRITVNVGQFVLAGEPVAVMGDGSVRTAAALALGAAQPILYIEFRKDGVAIDPGPWWAKPDLQKARG